MKNSGALTRLLFVLLSILIGITAFAVPTVPAGTKTVGAQPSTGMHTEKNSPSLKGTQRPGIPRKNIIGGPPLAAGTFKIGSKGLINPLMGGITRVGKAQDRDSSNADSDDIMPFFGPSTATVYFASTATGRRADTGLSGNGATYHIWRTDKDGLSATKITGVTGTVGDEINGDQEYPWVSKDGVLLAYSSRLSAQNNFDIYLYNFNRNLRTRITTQNPAAGNNIHPTLNPGGSQLVFASNRTNASHYRLFLANTTGGGTVRQITFDPPFGGNYSDTDPAWSPDGLIVAFTRTFDTGESHIYFIRDIINQTPTAVRETFFTANALIANEKQPSWTIYPLQADSKFHILFAATRTSKDANGNIVLHSKATDVTPGLWQIYDIPADQAESTTNPALLLTKDPGNGTLGADNGATYPSAGFPFQAPSNPPPPVVDYEFTYQSNRPPTKGAHDIWISLYNDVIAPLLENVPQITDSSGNPIDGRFQTPGSTFRIRAKVSDPQTGVKYVYAQFKDPDSASFDVEGLEHRLYLVEPGYGLSVTQRALDVFVEVGQEAINPDNYSYVDTPIVFHSGAATQADLNDMLQMWDDGPAPAGHEPAGEAAGDGIYTAQWQTPNVPSDFYVDIFAADNQGNEIVYDNISGFTTQAFGGGKPVLFVADHIAGQVFVQDLSADPVLGNTFARTTWAPVESYYTDNPTGIGINSTTLRLTSGDGTVVGIFDEQDPLGPFQPDGYDCDIWRTQCRGAVPTQIFLNNLPRYDDQPDPTNTTATRKILVCEHAIVWATPYAGDLFIPQDSIENQTVQNNVASFFDSAGRMLLTGQDVAWGITHGGQFANTDNDFLAKYFRVKYDTDTGLDILNKNYTRLRHQLTNDGGITGLGPFDHTWRVPRDVRQLGYPALGQDILKNVFLADPAQLNGPPSLPTAAGSTPYVSLTLLNNSTPSFIPVGGNGSTGLPYSGAWNQLWIDTVTAVGTAPSAWSYTNPGNAPAPPLGTGLPASPTAASYYDSPTVHAKSAFYAFGIEGVDDGFTDVPAAGALPEYISQQSRRYEMMHHALCWFFTSKLSGIVYGLDPQTQQKIPLAGVLVTMIDRNAKENPLVNTVTNTALTDSSGNYIIEGIASSDIYDVEAIKPGFRIQHPERIGPFHGLSKQNLNLIIEKEPPGFLTGKVVDRVGAPVNGVTVIAHSLDLATEPDRTATTDINGIFTFSLGSGNWKITVDPASLQALGYAPTTVPAFQNVVIAPNATVHWDTDPSKYFVAQPIPGALQGTVTAAVGGAPIANAQVTAVLGSGTNAITLGPVTTNAQGFYNFGSVLDPGTWTVTVVASGYKNKTQTVTIVKNQTSTLDFQLELVDPGILRGLVRRKNDQVPLAGFTVQALQGGNVVCSVSTFDPPLTTGGHVYNYEFSLANGCRLSGNVTVHVVTNGTGYTQPADVTVNVPSLQTVYAPTFNLDTLASFPSGLSLMSVPYDYLNDDPKTLLSGDANFRSYTYITPLRKYVFYPNLPNGNHFVRGRGYFVQDTKPLSITKAGTGDQTQPFTLTLKTGWNLIGDPFNFKVRWLTTPNAGQTLGARVVDPANQNNTLDMQTASARGYIGNAVYSEDSGVTSGPFYALERFTGYWVKCTQDLTVIVDPQGQISTITALNQSNITGANPYSPTDWRLQFIVATPLRTDTATFIGVTPSAMDGFDGGNDSMKPVPSAASFLFAGINHDDWASNNAGNYAIDLRNPSAVSQIWKLQVQVSEPNTPITISWPGMTQLPAGLNLSLFDPRLQQTVNLKRKASYTFTAPYAGSYTLTITAAR